MAKVISARKKIIFLALVYCVYSMPLYGHSFFSAEV